MQWERKQAVLLRLSKITSIQSQTRKAAISVSQFGRVGCQALLDGQSAVEVFKRRPGTLKIARDPRPKVQTLGYDQRIGYQPLLNIKSRLRELIGFLQHGPLCQSEKVHTDRTESARRRERPAACPSGPA